MREISRSYLLKVICIFSLLLLQGTRQEWQQVFIITSVVCLLGTGLYVILVKGEPFDWASEGAKKEDCVELKNILCDKSCGTQGQKI